MLTVVEVYRLLTCGCLAAILPRHSFRQEQSSGRRCPIPSRYLRSWYASGNCLLPFQMVQKEGTCFQTRSVPCHGPCVSNHSSDPSWSLF